MLALLTVLAACVAEDISAGVAQHILNGWKSGILETRKELEARKHSSPASFAEYEGGGADRGTEPGSGPCSRNQQYEPIDMQLKCSKYKQYSDYTEYYKNDVLPKRIHERHKMMDKLEKGAWQGWVQRDMEDKFSKNIEYMQTTLKATQDTNEIQEEKIDKAFVMLKRMQKLTQSAPVVEQTSAAFRNMTETQLKAKEDMVEAVNEMGRKLNRKLDQVTQPIEKNQKDVLDELKSMRDHLANAVDGRMMVIDGHQEEDRMDQRDGKQFQSSVWKKIKAKLGDRMNELQEMYQLSLKEVRGFKKSMTKVIAGASEEERTRKREMKTISSNTNTATQEMQDTALMAMETVIEKATTMLRRFVGKSVQDLEKVHAELKKEVRISTSEVKKAAAGDMKAIQRQQKQLERAQKEGLKLRDMRIGLGDTAEESLDTALQGVEVLGGDVNSDYSKLKEESAAVLSDMKTVDAAKVKTFDKQLKHEERESVSQYVGWMDEELYRLQRTMGFIRSDGNDEEELLDKALDAVNSLQAAVTAQVSETTTKLDTYRNQLQDHVVESRADVERRTEEMTAALGKLLGDIPLKITEAHHSAKATVDQFAADTKTAVGTFHKEWTIDDASLAKREMVGIENEGDELGVLKKSQPIMLDKLDQSIEDALDKLNRLVDHDVPRIAKDTDLQADGQLKVIAITGQNVGQLSDRLLEHLEDRWDSIIKKADEKIASIVENEANIQMDQKDTFQEYFSEVSKSLDDVQSKVREWVVQSGKDDRKFNGIWERDHNKVTDRMNSFQIDINALKEQVSRLSKHTAALTSAQSAKEMGEAKLSDSQLAFEDAATKIYDLGKLDELPKSQTDNALRQAVTDAEGAQEKTTRTMESANATLRKFDASMKGFENEAVMAAAKSSSLVDTFHAEVLADKVRLSHQAVNAAKAVAATTMKTDQAAAMALADISQKSQSAMEAIDASGSSASFSSVQKAKQMSLAAAAGQKRANADLKIAQAKLEEDMKRLAKNQADAAKEASAAGAAQAAKSDEVLALASAAAQIMGEDASHQNDLLVQKNEETGALSSAVSAAELAKHVMETVKQTVAGLHDGLASGWQAKQDAALHRMAVAMGAETSHKIEQETKDLEVRAEESMKSRKDSTAKIESVFRGTEEDTHKNLAELGARLKDEVAGQQTSANNAQSAIEKEGKSLAVELGFIVPKLESLVHEATNPDQTGRKAREYGLNRINSVDVDVSHDDIMLAEELHRAVQNLALKHAEVQQYAHVFQAKDLAWKQLVQDKLKDLGMEIDDTALNALRDAAAEKHEAATAGYAIEGEFDKDMTDAEKAQHKELAAIYAEQDAAIARLMKDESLSEEDRKARIGEIRAATAKSTAAIFAKQVVAQENQRKLEVALNKYDVMVEAASAATQRAIDAGHLAPTAKAVQDNLHSVGREIEKLRHHRMISGSVLQTGSAQALGHGHHILKKMNAHLESANDALEKELAALKASVAKHGAAALA